MAQSVDHFAALGLPRSAALDGNLVRERFHELSRELHPDAEGGDERKFAAINEAQRVLRSPSARLKHLLELENGTKLGSTGMMSAELMALFAELGEMFSRADSLIAKRNGASSAVAKALLAGEEVRVQQALMAAGGKLMDRRREIESGLEGVDVEQHEALSSAARELVFLEKWQAQVQERMGALI